MTDPAQRQRSVKIFRYDPLKGGDGHYDRFNLDIVDPDATTILDVLIRIQREQDPTVSFRYACRVNMCGSCGVVINGREGLACKTNVGDLPPGREITIRPLNHFPIVKDLVVDMASFFKKYEETMPYFSPACLESEPAIIRPDSPERLSIGTATECIHCGCCVSGCTMANYHDGYAGPAALNRAFTLLADSREGCNRERLRAVLESCYSCRTELNCTEVCPKELSPTSAIKYIQRLALKHLGELSRPAEDSVDFRGSEPVAVMETAETQAEKMEVMPSQGAVDLVAGQPDDPSRRRFFSSVTIGLGTICAAGMGGVLATAAIGPTLTGTPERWIPVCPMDQVPPGRVSTMTLRYDVTSGFHKETVVKPVMISRRGDVNSLVVYNTTCPHLGCIVNWDAGMNIFRCACHGGQFDHEGRVIAGPPPRPLDTHRFKVENGYLMVEVS